MNQFHWTYWDYLGRQHVVGILHGIKTGHLVIHLNSNILIIDFNVRQAKKYSFLINNEICELNIKEADNGFKYDLGLNEAQKARQKAIQKKKNRQELREKMGAFFLTSLLIFTITILIYFFVF
jgi:hypothetical protein